jgi:hypothetical protein
MKCISTWSSLLTITLAVAAVPSVNATMPGESPQDLPIIIQEDHHDTSPPLFALAQISPQFEAPVVALPLHRRPGPPIVSSQPDPVLQQQATNVSAALAISNLITFAGLNNLDGLVPADPNAAIGNSQIVETVNSHYQVFSTSGTSLLGPATIGSIWNGFGGQCDPTTAGGHVYSDPIVLRDKIAQRWLITVIGSSSLSFNSNNTECIAVSSGSDATGSYHRYAFSFGTTLNDYPKFGVWPDAYYASYNLFVNDAGNGAEACAYNRTAMLAGSAATSVCFQRSSDFSLLPTNFDGVTLPPSGEPNFYLELATSTTLKMFRFHVNFTTPSSSTFSGPVTITVASYSEACGGAGDCIPQPGGAPVLEGLGDRLMFPLSYRNFGDHESLVTNHSVAVGSGVGVRWYNLRSPNATPTVFQQGTYAPDSSFRWMGSINQNGNGNICLGYSVSSSTLFPSVRVACRASTDPLGTLGAENTIINGGGAQTGANRWGDYSSMAVDPADNTTFIYTNMVYRSSSSANWSTQIGSFTP